MMAFSGDESTIEEVPIDYGCNPGALAPRLRNWKLFFAVYRAVSEQRTPSFSHYAPSVRRFISGDSFMVKERMAMTSKREERPTKEGT